MTIGGAMSTTITRPPMTRGELADLRWLAAEAVADVSCSMHTGRPTAGDDLTAPIRLMECAFALGALGAERGDPLPGFEADDDRTRWPVTFHGRALTVLLREADVIEGWFTILRDDTDEAPVEALRAYYDPRIERVRRCRAILERAS
jgi:hypothetical protein